MVDVIICLPILLYSQLYYTQLVDGKVCFTSASAIPEHLRERPLADLKVCGQINEQSASV